RTGDVSEFIGEWDPVTRTKKNAQRNSNSAVIWHYGDREFSRSMSTVAIEGDMLLAADLAGFLHCLDLQTGKPFWKHDMLSAVWGSPSIIGENVYLGDEEGDVAVLALKKERALVGEVNMGGTVTSTAISAGNVLYVATSSQLFAIEQQ